jgi:regulator of nucleoside diphosphate kinase
MKAHPTPWLTEQDFSRLKSLLTIMSRQPKASQAGLDTLEEILEAARVVRPASVPRNVVTMNSRALYRDVQTKERGTATIVYPAQADPAAGRISVLSPMGAALLGLAEGEEAELPLPHGLTRRVLVLDILYQPEAEGHFAL